MTGLNSAISSALSGLDAFSEGIGTVGSNIANQSTDGYAERSVEIQTTAGGAGQSGGGVVDPALVRRASDAMEASNVYAATAANSAASTRASVLKAIDQAFTGNGDIESAASTFFSGLGTLASNPTNAAQVSTVLANAQALASGFNSAASALTSQTGQIGTRISQQVGQANTLLGELAKINKQLMASPEEPTLLDQQQATLGKLSSFLNINTLPLGSSGAVAVMTGGSVLVDQAGAQTLDMQSINDIPELTAGPDKQPLRLSDRGGSLGGLLSGLKATDDAGKRLDRIAGTIADLVNQSQAEGLTANGSAGKALFSRPQPNATPAQSNTGSATLNASVTDTSALPANGQGYTLSYSTAGWSATVPGSGQSQALGTSTPLTLNGMNIAILGTPAPGDSFRIAPDPGAAAALRLTSSDPSELAVADPYVLVAGTISGSGAVSNTNAGTINEGEDTVTTAPATGAAVVPGSAFGGDLELKFTTASSYDVIDKASGTTVSTGSFAGGATTLAVAYPASSSAAGHYWQVNLTGAPRTGDVATLTPGGLNSGSNAQRMSDLWTRTDSALPGGSMQGSVLSLIGETGAASAQATTLASNTASNLNTAQGDLTRAAGVNVDQQATLLTEYQQAYQAAAKVISTAHSMFNSLLQAI